VFAVTSVGNGSFIPKILCPKVANARKSLIYRAMECQCGGIGRHTGFKIQTRSPNLHFKQKPLQLNSLQTLADALWAKDCYTARPRT